MHYIFPPLGGIESHILDRWWVRWDQCLRWPKYKHCKTNLNMIRVNASKGVRKITTVGNKPQIHETDLVYIHLKNMKTNVFLKSIRAFRHASLLGREKMKTQFCNVAIFPQSPAAGTLSRWGYLKWGCRVFSSTEMCLCTYDNFYAWQYPLWPLWHVHAASE